MMEEFTNAVYEQYKKNMKKWKHKEDVNRLIVACVEEFGEIARCVQEHEDLKEEIIHLVAVLYQIYIGDYDTKIKVLIGSARFASKFIEMEKNLTFDGYTVLIPFWNGMLYKESYSDEDWEMLMGYAFRKIDLASSVFVINCKTKEHPNGYIGEHTRREIEYAISKGKSIEYLVPNMEPLDEREMDRK